MHVVIPFEQCVARPAYDGRPAQLLSDHLLRVAEQWSDLGVLCHSDEIAVAKTKERLLFLGGLLHDAGKARASWQKYISSTSKDKRGQVYHSPVGAALFFYVSHAFLYRCVEVGSITQKVARSGELCVLRIGITLDIAGHHGELKDAQDDPPWEPGFFNDHLDEMDLLGLFEFLESHVGAGDLGITPDGARQYLDGPALDEWNRLIVVTLPTLKRELMRRPDAYMEAAKMCLRVRTSGLIVADRFDAGGLERSRLSCEVAKEALKKVDSYLGEKASEALSDGADPNIISIRQETQDYAVATYLEHSDEGIYRLNLPTGMGKTMAALKVGLNSCAQGITERIIYVAPYISILSQAAGEIREATGLETIQHHYLSTLEPYEVYASGDERSSSAQSSDYVELVEEDYLLTMESWQAPVVATTFNQFFLALFPRRAQQTLRIGALHNAFIIIDEAQIIDANVWKLFLRMVEALVNGMGSQVLFITATMPPVENGLSKQPFSLAREHMDSKSRYVVKSEDEVFDVDLLVDSVMKSVDGDQDVAVVVNTVRNAAKIFSRLRDEVNRRGMANEVQMYHLSGAMTPLHKAYTINCVRSALASKDSALKESSESFSVVVVSTQVLEAGVDLSFDCIYRELPVLPSIIQVAGRANRHGEKQCRSEVRVFRFVDEKGNEPRRYVYRSPIWREETDRIIETTGGWSEKESSHLLEMFFRECYRRAPSEAFLQWLIDGALENGEELRKVVPFQEQVKPIDVFVPISEWITDSVRQAMGSFGVYTPDDLYYRYLEPGFLSSMSFVDRKRFFAVMQNFTVSLDWRKAMRIADKRSDTSLWRLVNLDQYDCDTGLAEIAESDFSFFSV